MSTAIVPYQKENEVVKNNSFIRCSNNLTPIQRKSFALLLKESIETIRESGEKRYYTMPLVEYKRIMGHPEKMPTKYISMELFELMTKVIDWDIDKDGYGTRSVMLSGFDLKPGTGILKWAFSPFLIDKLIADGYTPLKLSIVLNFESKYSIALYENIQMRKNFKKTTFGLQEFRALMGVEANEHPRMDNFKRKVLHPALAEINQKSDVKITYVDLKQGAKITGFEFSWGMAEPEPEKVEKRNQRSHQIEEHKKMLFKYYGSKVKIAGKWYVFSQLGFVNRGKIFGGFDIVESWEQYQILDRQKMVEEKTGAFLEEFHEKTEEKTEIVKTKMETMTEFKKEIAKKYVHKVVRGFVAENMGEIIISFDENGKMYDKNGKKLNKEHQEKIWSFLFSEKEKHL